MTIAEKKGTLCKRYADRPWHLTKRISEIVFDITTCLDVPKLCEGLDLNSRDLFEDIMNWAWEFEYWWTFEQDEDYEDYLTEVDTFAYKKRDELIEYYGGIEE